MEIRRGLLAQMAKENEIIRGQFKADEVGVYTINFGKTMTGRYMVYMEMTKDSKNAYAQIVSANRQYATVWINFDGCDYFNSEIRHFSQRYNGSALSGASTIGDITMYADRIEVTVNSLSGHAYTLYPDYTYDYMIIPID